MANELKFPSSDSTKSVYAATRYRQGNRTVYSLTLSPLELISTLSRPDPDRPATLDASNRAIRKKHAQGFANYFREKEEWVIPGLILRTSQNLKFVEITEHDGVQVGALQVTRIQANGINILDGQHRTLGFFLAAEQISAERDKLLSELQRAERQDPGGNTPRDVRGQIGALDSQLKRLETERVSVQLYVENSPQAFRQMFFDISDNALGITASVRARFDTRLVVNRALPAVLEHPLLEGRVELESGVVGRRSDKLLSAKQVADIVRTVNVGFNGRFGKHKEAEAKEKSVAKSATDFIDALLEAFAPLRAVKNGQLDPHRLRETTLLGSPPVLRALAGLYFELREPLVHGWSHDMVTDYFKALEKHMVSDGSPVYPGSIWLTHLPEGTFQPGANGPNGRRQNSQDLFNGLLEWALDKPDFIRQDPPPRPRVEEVSDDDILLAKEEAAERYERELRAAR